MGCSYVNKMLRPFVVTALAMALLMPGIAFAQRLEFEVASVKPNATNGPLSSTPQRSGNLIAMHNVRPFTVIYYAYNLNGSYQIAGYDALPGAFDWYDIDAVADASATEDQIRLMFQSLLEERFKLRFHRETRELSEYALVIKNKAKLTPAREGQMTVTIEGRTLSIREGSCMTTLWKEGSHITCHGASMDKVVAEIKNRLEAPVVDRTGLTGTYDLDVLYLPDGRKVDPDAPFTPSLQDAIQEQLGLKLEKGKGPVEVLVVEHLEKPSAN